MVLVQNKYKNTLVGVLRTQITFVAHSSPSCYVTLRTQVIRLNSGNLGPQKTDSGVFKKHIGGEAAGFRPKAGSCAFSCNHPRPNMADQNCNLGNDPASKPLPLTSFKSITA